MTNPNPPLGKHQQAVLDLIRKLGPWSLHGRPWDYGSRTGKETAGLLDTLVKRGLVTIIDVNGRSAYRAI